MDATVDISSGAAWRKSVVTNAVFATILVMLVALGASYFVARYQQDRKWREARRLVESASGEVLGRGPDTDFFVQFHGDTITDANLMRIRQLVDTDLLNLHQTRISDNGLAAIDNWQSLKYFGCQSDLLTDAALTHLQRHTQLERLELIGAQITDASLNTLATLKLLKILNLNCCTNLTKSGVAKLQAALPNCTINWSTEPYVPYPDPE
jgi:hypothetical protein